MALFNKKYKLKHEMRGDVLCVNYSGNLTRKEIGEIMDKIYQQMILHDAKKVLIDATESNLKLDLKESLEMAETQPVDLKLVKMAIIEKKEKAEQYHMFEMFSKNRGFPMRFFNTRKEAEDWLNIKN